MIQFKVDSLIEKIHLCSEDQFRSQLFKKNNLDLLLIRNILDHKEPECLNIQKETEHEYS